jgi:uncharacterized protein YifE (UPF0438 family)
MILGMAYLEPGVCSVSAAVHFQDFGQGLLRDQDVRDRRLGVFLREVDQGEPVPVGRDELEFLALVLQERPHELEASLLGRDRI